MKCKIFGLFISEYDFLINHTKFDKKSLSLMTTPFNPAAFQKKDGADATKAKAKQSLPFESTENSTRDQHRKMFWEIFNSSDQDKQDGMQFSQKDIVAAIETEIFESTGSDPKTKEYRDKSRSLQMKLKGPRFQETRLGLRNGATEVKHVCSEEFLSGKAEKTTSGTAAGRGAPGARGRGGLPGARGRGGPPGMAGRGRGMPPMGRGGPGQRPGMAAPFRAPMGAAAPMMPTSTQDEIKEEKNNEQQTPVIEEQKEITSEQQVPVETVTQKEQPVQEVVQNQQTPRSEQVEEKVEMKQPEETQEDRPLQITPKKPQVPMQRGPPQPFRPGAGPQRPKMPPFRPAMHVKSIPKQNVDETKEESKLEISMPDMSTTMIDTSTTNITNPPIQEEVLDFEDKTEVPPPEQNANNLLQPVISASLDDSTYSIQSERSKGDSSTGGKKKKKLKKKKKVSKTAGGNTTRRNQPELVEDENRLKQMITNLDGGGQPVGEEKKEEVKPVMTQPEIQPEQIQQKEQKISTPQNLVETSQEEIAEKAPQAEKAKPKELQPEEIKKIIDEKKQSGVQIGKLTQENLDERFKDEKNNTPKFEENDIETESIMMDQSVASPRGLANIDQSFQDVSVGQGLVTDKKEKDGKLSVKAAGEQIINKTNTVQSKSLTHSQIGAPEAESVRRINEALQSKKDLNNDLNQQILNLKQDQTFQAKRMELIQDDNTQLREEIKRLKKEAREYQEQQQILAQQVNSNQAIHQRQVKEKEDALQQQAVEIENLKQERDTYKDRLQRALRESQTQREQMERSISNQSAQAILQNIRSIGSLAVFHRVDNPTEQNNRPRELNSASNQQEINLQKEINELRNHYEKQLRDQRHELVMRTRDLQKVERKNIKYRENNRILSDTVQNLENQNLTSAAGSGTSQNDVYKINFQQIIRETNEDLIETMEEVDELEEDHQENQSISIQQNNEQNQDANHIGQNQFDQNNILNQNNEGGASGLFNHNAELNSGDHGQRRVTGAAGGGYFDNAQDEATGGEGHSNLNNMFEEEKQTSSLNQIDQQSALAQENSNTNNQCILEQNTQNNQSAAPINELTENMQAEMTQSSNVGNAYANDGVIQGSSSRAN